MSKQLDDAAAYARTHYRTTTQTWSQWYTRYRDSLHALQTLLIQSVIHPTSWLMMLLRALYWVTTWFAYRRYTYKYTHTADTDLTVREEFLYEAVSQFVNTATWEQYRALLTVHHGIEDWLFKPTSIPFTHNKLSGHWYGRDLAHSVEPRADDSKRHNVVLYFHGGGFQTGGSAMYPSFYMDMSTMITQHTSVTTHVLSINYALTTTVKCPEPVNEGLAAYDYLVDELKIEPHRILIGGDSAGGNLTLALAHRIRDSHRPMCAGLLLVSPWCDINPDSCESDASSRDYLTRKSIQDVSSFYMTSKHKYTDPECSPLYGDQHGLPPVCITYGGREIFRTMIRQLIDKMKQSDVQVEVITDPRLYHIAPLFAHISKGSAKQSVKDVAMWCSQILKKADKK